jgi:hypothetical protein
MSCDPDRYYAGSAGRDTVTATHLQPQPQRFQLGLRRQRSGTAGPALVRRAHRASCAVTGHLRRSETRAQSAGPEERMARRELFERHSMRAKTHVNSRK